MNDNIWLPPSATSPQSREPILIGVFVPSGRVFPGIHATADELKKQLVHLSRTDSLIWCARLNLVVSNATYRDHLTQQRFAIHAIFSAEEAERIGTFFAEQNTPECTAAFFRSQLLELMQWLAIHCCDLPDDGLTFEEPSVRQAFGKAALLASELWSSRTYAKMALGSSIEEARRTGLGAMRSGLEATSAGLDPMLAIGRGRQMFLEHFAQVRPTISQEFSEVAGLSLETFYALTTIVAVYFLLRDPSQGGQPQATSGLFHQEHFAVNEELRFAFRPYVELVSQTPEELASELQSVCRDTDSPGNWRGLGCIRRKPILRTKDGRCIVMDPGFFGELAAVGPLFAILRSKTGRKDQDGCFEGFGYAFERYAHSVLRLMYPTPPSPMIDRVECPVMGTSQDGHEIEIADACLNDVTDVVLFEMKARWLRDEYAEADDPSCYVNALQDLYARPKKEKVSPKGAGQLAASIACLASGEWKPRTQDFTCAQTIYPVLLCYDPRLQAPAHTWYLAQEFRSALAPDEEYADGVMRKGRFRVSGLIVLSIDDLEVLERSVENFSLTGLLRDYSQASPDRMQSIHTFIATSDYNKRLFASRGLAEGALAALRDAADLMGIPREPNA